MDCVVIALYREGSLTHVAPTVGRSSETLVVSLMKGGLELRPIVLRDLNRLSEMPWLYGRQIEHEESVTAVLLDEKTPGPRWSRAW